MAIAAAWTAFAAAFRLIQVNEIIRSSLRTLLVMSGAIERGFELVPTRPVKDEAGALDITSATPGATQSRRERISENIVNRRFENFSP